MEEVVTSKPDPVLLVAGRFEKFKRDSRIRKRRANLCRAKDRWHKRGRKLRCTIRRAKTKGRECLWCQLGIVTKVESYRTHPIPAYHKTIPGLKTGFDLPMECFPAMEKPWRKGLMLKL